MKVFDVANNQFLTDGGGAINLTTVANTLYNLRLDYQGTAKKAALPFGGCMAIEYPATITSVTVNGAGIDTMAPCAYAFTYSVSSVSNTYKLFAIPDGFDKNGVGDIKSVALQFQAGSSAPTGTVYIKAQSAQYYTTNAGDIVLGVEKDKNQDTTKTGTTTTASFVMQ